MFIRMTSGAYRGRVREFPLDEARSLIKRGLAEDEQMQLLTTIVLEKPVTLDMPYASVLEDKSKANLIDRAKERLRGGRKRK